MSGETIRFAGSAELDAAVQRLADAAGSTAAEVLPAQMRLLAVALAAKTRPYGATSSAQKEGIQRVEARITDIYPSVGMIAARLEKKEPRLKKAFIAKIKKKDFDAAEKIANDVLKLNCNVGEFDGGSLHRQQKFTKYVKHRLVVTNYKNVESYMASKKRLVGFAKGGFATAARQLGGVRGIPGFATRQQSPGSGSVTTSINGTVVTMINGVKYIEQALDRRGEADALSDRARNIDARINIMMGVKNRSASRSIK